jgi:hypothetical protein
VEAGEKRLTVAKTTKRRILTRANRAFFQAEGERRAFSDSFNSIYPFETPADATPQGYFRDFRQGCTPAIPLDEVPQPF